VTVDPAIVDYISAKRREGYGDHQIKEALASLGFDSQAVELAFAMITPAATPSAGGWATPPTCTLTVSPKKLKYGQSTVLTWTTSNASEAHWVIDNRYGPNPIGLPPGIPSYKGASLTFKPMYTATSTVGVSEVHGIGIAVTGPGGSIQCIEYITVDPS
jgi:hypothetical protein